MAVQNIECQIARMQIGRVLAGSNFPGETIKQLEDHIAKCPDCKNALVEHRAQLEKQISQDKPTKAVVHTEESEDEPSAPGLSKRILDSLRLTQPDDRPTTSKMPMAKTVLYVVALAGVLVGMGMLSKGSNSILGPRADSMLSQDPASASTATPAIKATLPNTTKRTTPESVNKPAHPNLAVAPRPPQAQPVQKLPASKPAAPQTPHPITKKAPHSSIRTVSQPDDYSSLQAKPALVRRPKTAHPRARRYRTWRRAAHAPKKNAGRHTGTIRIYDANGKPINPP